MHLNQVSAGGLRVAEELFETAQKKNGCSFDQTSFSLFLR
jgi:hypothetical protein